MPFLPQQYLTHKKSHWKCTTSSYSHHSSAGGGKSNFSISAVRRNALFSISTLQISMAALLLLLVSVFFLFLPPHYTTPSATLVLLPPTSLFTRQTPLPHKPKRFHSPPQPPSQFQPLTSNPSTPSPMSPKPSLTQQPHPHNNLHVSQSNGHRFNYPLSSSTQEASRSSILTPQNHQKKRRFSPRGNRFPLF